MAEIGKASVGVRVEIDIPHLRQWAFEQAVETCPNGSKLDDVLKRAEKIMAFINTGKTE